MRTDTGIDNLGRRCLKLVEAESWRDFECVVFSLVWRRRGRISKKTDGPDARVWDIEFGGARVVVSYDDLLGTRVHFDPDCPDETVVEISELLSSASLRPPSNTIAERIAFHAWRMFHWLKP